MRNSLSLAAAVFCTFIASGALVSDSLIQHTLPGDPCYSLFLWATVAMFTAVFAVSMLYLGVLVVRVVKARWIRLFPNNGIAHATGCAALMFTAMSPIIVLHGPRSSVSYGERVAVIEALEHALAAEKIIERFWRTHGHFPGDIGEAGLPERPASSSSALGRFNVTNDGALTLTFASRRYASLDGRTLVIRPTTHDGSLQWECRGGDLPDHVRPAQCRRESACRIFGLASLMR